MKNGKDHFTTILYILSNQLNPPIVVIGHTSHMLAKSMEPLNDKKLDLRPHGSVLMFLQTESIDKQHNWKIEVWRWSSLTFYLESEIDLHKQAGVDPKIVTLNSFIVAWWYVVIIQTFALFFYFRFYFHLNNFSRYVIQQIHLPNISTWMNTMTATFQLASLTTRQI